MNDQSPSASDGLVSLPAIVDMAQTYKLSPKAFAFTFRSVAMPQPHTEAEFVSCCLVAREHGLNPLTKEIYFMRDKTGAIQAIVGVEGWIKKCNEHPRFDGIEFDDLADGSGKVTAIKARIYRSDRKHPIEVTEYLAECLQSRSKPGPWQSHPNRMLRHRALIQCARIAFGFAGIMDRDEFDQWQSMKDVTPKAKVSLDAVDVPEMPSEDETQDVPDIPMDEDDPSLSDERIKIDEIRMQLSAATSTADRQAIEEHYADIIAAMSEGAQEEVQAILEGRG